MSVAVGGVDIVEFSCERSMDSGRMTGAIRFAGSQGGTLPADAKVLPKDINAPLKGCNWMYVVDDAYCGRGVGRYCHEHQAVLDKMEQHSGA